MITTRACTLLLFLFLGCGGQTPKELASSEPLTFEHVPLNGLRASEVPAQERVFFEEQAWREFWTTYGNGNSPPIDFQKEGVAVASAGARPNSGYGLRILDVRKEPDAVRVFVEETVPNRRLGYAAVIVYPNDAVRFAKVRETVLFCSCQKVASE